MLAAIGKRLYSSRHQPLIKAKDMIKAEKTIDIIISPRNETRVPPDVVAVFAVVVDTGGLT